MIRVLLTVLDEEVTDGCVATMSPLLREHTIIHDHSDTQFAFRGKYDIAGVYQPPPHNPRYRPVHNAGMSRAFNVGAREVLDWDERHGGDNWLIWLSPAMRFGLTGGNDILDALSYGLGSGGGVAVFAPGLWHSFAVPASTLRTVGLMDENFFPAYLEDTDYRYRLRVAGLERRHVPIDAALPNDGHAHNTLRQLNPGKKVINWDAMAAYYKKKWGGWAAGMKSQKENNEKYTTPFNRGGWLGEWDAPSRDQLISDYGLGK